MAGPGFTKLDRPGLLGTLGCSGLVKGLLVDNRNYGEASVLECNWSLLFLQV